MPPTITLQSAEAAALERAFARTAGRMLAQIQAISNAPNSQMQRSLKKLDQEADRLTEADERMTVTNPQLEQTLREYESMFITTQTLILANDNPIQDAVVPISIAGVTAKVFSSVTNTIIARGINPLSTQAARIFRRSVGASGIPWVIPSPADIAADFVGSPAWINRMENWGEGYAELTRDTFLKGIQSGWGPKFTASQIRTSAENLPQSAAESLTRTLQVTSYRDASLEMEQLNNQFIRGKVRISALKDTSCLNCISRHGDVLAVGERVDDHFRGLCTEFFQVVGGPDFPDTMQADSQPGARNFVKYQSGEDWFNSLPPERQARQASFLRSPAKLRAFNDGTQLSVFQGDHFDDVFGKQTVEQSLKNAVGLEQAESYYTINQ